MTKRNRAAARLLSAVILSAVILSVLFLAKEADHDCTGENCPICHAIRDCARALNLLGAAVPGAAILAGSRFVVPASVRRYQEPLFYNTLIRQKVRLND